MVTVSDSVVLKFSDQVFKRPWQNRAGANETVLYPSSHLHTPVKWSCENMLYLKSAP